MRKLQTMKLNEKPLVILMADDDSDDLLLMEEAFVEVGFTGKFHSVGDGEALLDYLMNGAGHPDAAPTPRPDLILLDLNMPRKDGREALREIKMNQSLKRIPIVILTTSEEGADIRLSYEMGASSFISKASTFDGLVEIARSISNYWFEVVRLPPNTSSEAVPE